MYKEYFKEYKSQLLLSKDLKCLCCNTIIKLGTIINTIGFTSKNRILIESEGNIHKVKYSSIRIDIKE